jgi:hypothetical protein
MVQRRSCTRLSLESLECLGVSRSVLGEELQGNASVQPGVLCSVNYPHAAATQLFLNTIVRDCLSGERPRLLHGPVILGALPTQVNAGRPLPRGDDYPICSTTSEVTSVDNRGSD